MATPVRFRGQFAAQAEILWNSGPLQRTVALAFRDAVRDTGKVAKATAPSATVGRSVSSRLYSGGAATLTNLVGIVRARSPLAHLFEAGTDPHVIAPAAYKFGARALSPNITRDALGNIRRSMKASTAFRRAGGRVALKFPDGGFSRAPVTHPGMEAQPFMKPAAAVFGSLFRSRLRRAL